MTAVRKNCWACRTEWVHADDIVVWEYTGLATPRATPFFFSSSTNDPKRDSGRGKILWSHELDLSGPRRHALNSAMNNNRMMRSPGNGSLGNEHLKRGS